MTDLELTIGLLAATWVLVAGILSLWYLQTRQARHLNSATALLALKDRFEASKMRVARRALARDLLEGSISEVTTVEVPVFFELMGALVHRGALDEPLVWSAFGGWVTNYYHAMRHPVDYIGRSRSAFRDPTIFREFEWLHGRMTRRDRRHGGPIAPTSADEESREILRHEAGIDAGT